MSESPGEAGEVPPKNKSSKVVRYVLFAVLAVALVALGIDVMARSAWNSATEKLDAEMRRAKSLEQFVSRAKVRELMGREPEEGERQNIDVYVWPSVFKRYTIVAHFPGDSLEEYTPGSKWIFSN